MTQVLDTETIEKLWETAKNLPIPIKPWRDEDGREYYLLTCAPGSPGAKWAAEHPDLLRRVEGPLGPMLILPDPADEPSLWAALGGEAACTSATTSA